MNYGKDIYVIRYGSSRWGWKYDTSCVQKLCSTKEEAIEWGSIAARRHESDLYVEGKDGKFKKLKLGAVIY
jgi:hypothetical protein